MNDVWATVVAALGGSALTGLFSVGVLVWQKRQTVRDRSDGERLVAYGSLLSAAARVAYTAQMLRTARFLRSGIGEGIDVLTGARQPVDIFTLDARLAGDYGAFVDAWTAVWTCGSQEAIVLANTMGDACDELFGLVATPATGRPRWDALLRGERPSAEEERAWQLTAEKVGAARRQFVELVRREVGKEPVALYSGTSVHGGSARDGALLADGSRPAV